MPDMFCFQLIKVFIVCFFLVNYTHSKFLRKCLVHNSMTDHPEKPRMPPKSVFPLSRTKSSRNMIPLASCEEKYSIPIIWHIIMDSNGNGHLSDKKIKEQMKVLHEGFKDTVLRLRLHTINRLTNDAWAKFCHREKATYMSKLSIDPASNLNIYTCPLDYKRLGLVGNAALPWTYKEESQYNAVLIHPGTFPAGSILGLNEGKNLIHEIGHYFGLLHYFENQACDGDGDLVDDTPISREPEYSCPTSGRPTDTCPQQPGLDPIHNYMGYAEDSCVNEFTPGQIERISWIIKKYKKTLTSVVHRPCTIDSVFRWSDGSVYFFSGKSYYKYNETLQSIGDDYPRSINEHWRGVPNNIDGVFRYSNGITYFFKGSYYYRFNDSTLNVDPGYPKNIFEFWKGIPSDIDDVIRYSNGYTYFFKDDVYYRFNPTTASVDQGYPAPMNQYWIGIPQNIQGAFTWYNGGVYFYKDDKFALFTPTVNHNAQKPSSPKSIKIWWEDPQKFNGYSVFRHCNGYTYFVSGDQYWRFNDLKCSVDYEYPQPLSNWRGLPSKIDGIFVWSNGYMYVFSGEFYYRFNQTTQTVCQGYPKTIYSYWQGIPNNIDAVFRSNNGVTYFFKDSEYYRFNDVLHEVKAGYPKPISSFWKGIPNNVDTVFRFSDNQTYFFKGNFYYRFDFTKEAVDDGYPRHVSETWKGVLYSP